METEVGYKFPGKMRENQISLSSVQKYKEWCISAQWTIPVHSGVTTVQLNRK